jgi:hypothetical protein
MPFHKRYSSCVPNSEPLLEARKSSHADYQMAYSIRNQATPSLVVTKEAAVSALGSQPTHQVAHYDESGQ